MKIKTVKKTFRYTNFAPPAAVDSKGRRLQNTNDVTLERDSDNNIVFTRQYVSKDGKISSGITSTFGQMTSPEKITRMIHWGCCGWDGFSDYVNGQVKDFFQLS